MRRYFFGMLLALCTGPAVAQQAPEAQATAPLLTLEQAVATALEQNFDIRIAREQMGKADNDYSYRNAVFLPTLSAGANATKAINGLKQEFAGGTREPLDQKGVHETNLGGNVQLAWTLFDGLRMFVARERLEQLTEVQRLQLKAQVQQSVAQVVVAYYQVVGAQQQLLANAQSLRLAEENAAVSEARSQAGTGRPADVLQAKVERNAQKALRIQLENQLAQAANQLNVLLGQPADRPFGVSPDFTFGPLQSLEQIRERMGQQNFELLSSQRQVSLSELSIKDIQRQRIPTLEAVSSYTLSDVKSDGGFFTRNQRNGFNYGLRLSIPIFNRFNLDRQVRNARYDLRIAQLTYEKRMAELQAQVLGSFRDYQYAQQAMSMEQENATLAQENADINLARLRLGQATVLEVLQAQKSYQDAMTRLIQARILAKNAETELLRLQGALVQ